MANPVLEAVAREGVGKGAARTVRRQGLVPGVIYGGGEDPITISLKHNELLKALKRGKFKSTLFDLLIDGKKISVVARDVQRNVVLDLPIHVDFLRLSEKSRINLFIPVEFANEPNSPGLKRGGVLNIVRHEIEMNVRASAIPEMLTVDLSGLDVGDVVHISHIDLPAGATPVISDRDFAVATIAAPSSLRSSDEDDGEEGVEGESKDGEDEAEE